MNIEKPKKWEDLLAFLAVILTLILINIQASEWFFRVDLTEDDRYTVSAASKHFLQELDDVVYVEVFLDGELEADYRRLQKSIRETLEEFKLYAGDKLEFKFTNPDESSNQQVRGQVYKQIMDRGIEPTTEEEEVNGEKRPRYLFPGAVVSYRNREKPVLLLKGANKSPDQEVFNRSVEGVEYELINAIRQLAIKNKKRIAFTQGHEELRKIDLANLMTGLEETYLVDFVQLASAKLEDYDALVIAQPKTKFSDQDKFLIDQYIMKGGNTMFLIDPIQMNIDSLPLGGTYAFGYDLQLDDLLFRYGIRVENTLIQDVQAGAIELNTGNFGDGARIRPVTWPYYVKFNKFSNHPIVRNLDVIYGKFISTIDTVKAKGIRKTPLVFSSKYTRVKKAPTLVDLNELRNELRVKENYNRKHLPVAYLLEGKFKSLFANQGAPIGIKVNTVVPSGESKILVFSDADIIRNEIDRNNQPMPIDYDLLYNQHLSNKDFFLNALAYMTDEDGIINARKKQITLRPLDTVQAKEDKLTWQVINLLLPVLAIVFFGMLYGFLRRRKYTKH